MSMKAVRITSFFFFMCSLSACVLPAQGTQAPQTLAPGVIYTQAVLTVEAQLTAAFFTPTSVPLENSPTPLAPSLEKMQPTANPTITPTQQLQAILTKTEVPTAIALYSPTPILSPTPLTSSIYEPRIDLGEPDFIDPFDSAVNWALTVDEHIEMQIKEGQMILTAFNPDLYNGWGFSKPFLRNFYLEIRVYTGEKCSGRDRYGIIFRAPDASRGYLLGFSCNGEYALWYWNSDREIYLLDWTADSSINPGLNQSNLLGIKAQGDRLELFANGILLKEVHDSINLEGYFGLFIGAAQTPGFSIKVDSLEYWELE